MRVFGYCCARSVDIVCQACGAVSEMNMFMPTNKPNVWKYTPEYTELDKKMTLEGRGELGFIGKTDARETFHEAFPDKVLPVTKPQ